MKSVAASVDDVEAALCAGFLRCPSCTGTLRGWGWARRRNVRTLTGSISIRPRRARCAQCQLTHVLLPDFMVLRRADTIEVIEAALDASSRAWGYRRVARALDRPASTVRDWLRRWKKRMLHFGSSSAEDWRGIVRRAEGRFLAPVRACVGGLHTC